MTENSIKLKTNKHEDSSMRKNWKILLTSTLATLMAGNATAATSSTDTGLGVQLGRIAEVIATAFSEFMSGLGDPAQMAVGMIIVLISGGLGYFFTGENETVGVITIILVVMLLSVTGIFPGFVAPVLAVLAAAFIAAWGSKSIGGV